LSVRLNETYANPRDTVAVTEQAIDVASAPADEMRLHLLDEVIYAIGVDVRQAGGPFGLAPSLPGWARSNGARHRPDQRRPQPAGMTIGQSL